MKIGILTFHSVPNFGAALQAFALKTHLESLHHTAHVIDFKCAGNNDNFRPEILKKHFSLSKNPLKRAGKSLLFQLYIQKSYQKKCDRFAAFSQKHFDLLPYINDRFDGFDAIFCGSDQIWNPKITAGFQQPYFGADPDSGVIAASYAASCGDVNELSGSEKSEFFNLLKRMRRISVREQSLCAFLKEEGVPASCVLDPTFLLSDSDYIDKLSLQKTDGPKYLLQYSLQKSDKLDQIAAQIAKEKGLKIVNVCGYIHPGPHEDRNFDAGPVEFLQYLYNASYVLTNSFHGVALSLIFKKDFNALLPAVRKARIADLLAQLSLSDRICNDTDTSNTESINYTRVSADLEPLVASSKAFVLDVLRGEE